MVKITIEDFFKATGSVTKSTVLAFKRAKQLSDEGWEPTLDVRGHKETLIAVLEVINKKIIPVEREDIKVDL